jgi:polysaccharide export outer membrane protein
VRPAELAANLALFAAFALLGGCETFLPSAGPSADAVNAGASTAGLPYTLVKLTPEVVDAVGERSGGAIAATFGDRRPPPEIRFGVGDVVNVTIFEANAGGLFIPQEAGVRPGNFVTLPNQPIDTAGNISVPYGGALRAAGKTPSEVQSEIVAAIRNRAIDPQAVVALATQNTSLISVLGEVNTPNRFPAQPAGEHLLDAITRAGGIKDQGYDTWVVLERKGTRAAVPFGELVANPANNVWVWPNDTIYVYQQPQTFLAFGASGQQGQFNFGAWRISLAEAVAKAGGLLDVQADPASVYLYRREPREVAKSIGVDVTNQPGPTAPVIYNVNFQDPAGYFLATKMQMRDKDIVFAANAEEVQLNKFVNLLEAAALTADYGTASSMNAKALR